jgi:putative transcriptional regulator
MSKHHPPADLVFDYAAGSLPEPVSLAVASHLALCSDCAEVGHAIEDVGGALLEVVEPFDVADDALDAIMSRLDEPMAETTHTAAEVDQATRMVAPQPLLPYLGRGFEYLAWRRVGRMFEQAELVAAGGFKAMLMRLKPGAVMPVHTHRGSECTLVLAGGYKDKGKQFLRGDFDFKDPSHEHQPIVDPDGECLCLVALDAPVKLTGTVSRFFNPLLKI